MNILNYTDNCFWFIIPVVIWNIIFTKDLPDAYSKDFFWHDLPTVLTISEKVLRTCIFIFPLFMSFSEQTAFQNIGLLLYLTGIILYFAAWLAQIYLPNSKWSKSIWGFMAPAYLPLIWLLGIGITGYSSINYISYISPMYILFAILFVIVHSIHTSIIYHRRSGGFY